MKKVLPLLIVLFLALPFTNVFAQSGGLLNGKTLTVINSSNVTTGSDTNTTDNNTSTAFSIFSSADSANALIYTFSSVQDINNYYIDADVSSNLRLVFYDTNGNTIGSVMAGLVNRTKTAISYNNVKKVKIYNASSTAGVSYSLREFDVFGTNSVVAPVTNLTETHSHDSVTLRWTNPASSNGIVILQNGVTVANLTNVSSYTVNGLLPKTTYSFGVGAKYPDGSISANVMKSVTTDPEPIDNTPPSEISNLSVVKTHNSANFVYTMPTDSDFSHLEIYRDTVLLNSNFKNTIYDDTGLVPNTTYVYRFVSVDLKGNKSNGYSATVKTDIEQDSIAPSKPTGLTTIEGNASGRLTWKENVEPDLDGYNIYIDGVKANSSLVRANNYILTGLENKKTYSISVTAVDTSGNESPQSMVVSLIPSQSAMPVFKSDFELKDVATGTSNWFGSLWPILAFSVGITLAFIVSNRIKHLFLA